MSFYGNITDRRNQFTYDKIYSSLTKLLNNENTYDPDTNKILLNQDDSVLAGRFVLIDYDFEGGYDNNAQNDISNYQDSFDSTVWQKIYSGGAFYYILIANLSSSQEEIVKDLLYSKNKGLIEITQTSQDEDMSLKISTDINTYTLVNYLNKNSIYYIGLGDSYAEIINVNTNSLLDILYSTQQTVNGLMNISEQDKINILSNWDNNYNDPKETEDTI